MAEEKKTVSKHTKKHKTTPTPVDYKGIYRGKQPLYTLF